MITPTVIILLKLPFVHGMSHPVKATSGSLVVSGCGRRYGNSAQCFAAMHFPSLRTGADLYGGIFTPVDIVPLDLCLISLLFILSLLCFKARVKLPIAAELRGISWLVETIEVTLTMPCPNRSRAAGHLLAG